MRGDPEAEGEVGPALHWQLEQRRLRRRLDGFVNSRAEHGVRPVATELQFGTRRPFAITLPAVQTLALSGVIDHVDAGPIGWPFIDYKTGRARSSQTDSPAARLAAHDLLERPDVEVVAEYWHLQDRHDERKRLPIDVDPRTLARLAEVVAAIVDGIGAGLLVPHPDEPEMPWRRARCRVLRP